MLIYRVETPEGLGPWCDESGDWSRGAGTSWCGGAVSLHSSALTLLQSTKATTAWRFGFINLDQLLHYTTHMNQCCIADRDRECLLESMQRMKSQNLWVSVYEVSHSSAIGDPSQCIFEKDRATFIKRLDPTGKFMTSYIMNYGSTVVAMMAD